MLLMKNQKTKVGMPILPFPVMFAHQSLLLSFSFRRMGEFIHPIEPVYTAVK